MYLGESSRTLSIRSSFHFLDYIKEMKKGKGQATEKRRDDGAEEERRRGSKDEEEDVSLSSWMAEHTRDSHGGIMSADPQQDYEFV